MKGWFIKFCSVFNKFWLLLTTKGKIKLRGTFYRVKMNQSGNNAIEFKNADIRNVSIIIKGSQNNLECYKSYIDKSTITIAGSNNRIIIREGVEIRNGTIIIRGSGCEVEIGKSTTFGGVRIINVGTENKISIGDGCMFSDNIEIWASDTHPIFNEQGEWINREKPITIGNGVWVGSRVIILKGVEIGDGSIIGMGSLVTKSVSQHAIAVGAPSREILKGIRWGLDYPIN